jgi:hypothetical protein
MKQKRESNLLAKISFTILLVGLILNLPCISKAEDVKKDAKIKPDIIIKDFDVIHSITSEGDIKVSITVKLFNGVKGTATGPFKVRVEWKDDSTTRWNQVNRDKVIPNLVNSLSAAKIPVATLQFLQRVPNGPTYTFRVFADATHRVYEGTEGERNNTQSYTFD